MRLLSMIGMLVVLGMLILRARDPANWKWLTNEPENAGAPSEAPQSEAPQSEAPQSEAPQSEAVVKVESETVEVAAADSPAAVDGVPNPLTDEDPEQRERALEEFQAVTDKTTELGPEEMPAYWRMLAWVHHQPLAVLKKRSTSQRTFNDLIQEPDVHRGELIKLDLNVRRVLAYDAPENDLGLEKIYEIWGWTTESKAWLYVVVTPELPKGMPLGVEVADRATLYGYFFKLQGYLEAGAGPRDKPLAAPLLVGLLERRPLPVKPPPPDETPWIFALVVVAGCFVAGRIVLYFVRGRRGKKEPVERSDRELAAKQWIQSISQPDADAPVIEDDTPSASSSPNTEPTPATKLIAPSKNGH